MIYEEEEERNMQSALAEVVQLRALLRRLGECPDEQSVNLARRRIIGIDYQLSSGTLPLPAREVAKQLRSSYRSVIKLSDMYLAYQELLHDAELRLDHIRQGRICQLKKNAEMNGNEAVQQQQEDPCLDNGCADDMIVEGLVNGVTGMVEHLEFCEGGLKAFPKEICRAVSLVSLNLSMNVLTSVPEVIGELFNLEKLDLHHNLLELLPETLGLLQKLKVLNVSYNRLTALPDGLDMCMDLVELNAAYNELRYVPAHFGYKKVKLEVLLLGNNKLTSLPSCVGAMTALLQLEVQFNHLACLPPNIGCLRKLKLLNVSGNFSDMVSLPDSIGDLIELEEINLRDNQITDLPYSFGALQNLKRIDLEHNPLTVPPMEVVGKGIEAVKEFMAKRWVEYLVEQEKRVEVSGNGHVVEETGWNFKGWFSTVFGGSNMNNSVLNEYH